MYTPVNPSFTIQKWGSRGSELYRRVLVMENSALSASSSKLVKQLILYDLTLSALRKIVANVILNFVYHFLEKLRLGISYEPNHMKRQTFFSLKTTKSH